MRHIFLGYTLRLKLLEYLIIRAVPLLNRLRTQEAWQHSITALRAFPQESWGLALTTFLAERSFADFLPNYATHDAFHVLLQYETDVQGELRLQAFMHGNRSSSVAGRGLLLLGMLLIPELWSQLQQDSARGQQSARIGAWDVPVLLEHNFSSLQCQIAPFEGLPDR